MVKLTHIFIMSILILWLAASGCAGNDKEEQEAGPAPNVSENTSANQVLTEADVQEFDKNATDLENLLENSTEEIVIEEL